MLPPAAGLHEGFHSGFPDGSAGLPPEPGRSRRWIAAVIASALAVLVLTVLAALTLAPGLPAGLGLGSSAQSPTVQPSPSVAPATRSPTPAVTPTATSTPTTAPTADPETVRLRDECAAGSGRSCDGLYVAAAAGGADETFADSCGRRYTDAEKLNSPDCNDRTRTDPADITTWSNGCHDGVPEDCDLLFELAPFDSLEFTYGRACGGLRRVPQGPTEGGTCVEPAG